MGRFWVKPHKKGGHPVKGYWRTIKGGNSTDEAIQSPIGGKPKPGSEFEKKKLLKGVLPKDDSEVKGTVETKPTLEQTLGQKFAKEKTVVGKVKVKKEFVKKKLDEITGRVTSKSEDLSKNYTYDSRGKMVRKGSFEDDSGRFTDPIAKNYTYDANGKMVRKSKVEPSNTIKFDVKEKWGAAKKRIGTGQNVPINSDEPKKEVKKSIETNKSKPDKTSTLEKVNVKNTTPNPGTPEWKEYLKKQLGKEYKEAPKFVSNMDKPKSAKSVEDKIKDKLGAETFKKVKDRLNFKNAMDELSGASRKRKDKEDASELKNKQRKASAHEKRTGKEQSDSEERRQGRREHDKNSIINRYLVKRGYKKILKSKERKTKKFSNFWKKLAGV